QDEVRHERTSVNPSGHAALVSRKHRRTLRARRECFVQGEISPTPEAIVEEIAFNGWPNYARAKDVTEFEAAEKADVIFGVHDEVASKKRRIRIIVRKSLGVAAILVDIRARIDRPIKASSPKWWRRRGDLLVDLLPSLQRNGCESEQK